MDSARQTLLVINLRAPDSYVNFIFEHSGNSIEGEPIFGSYNISYYRKNGNGIGNSILIKESEDSKLYEKIKPESIHPLSNKVGIHEKLIAYLMFKNQSVIRPVLKRDRLPARNMFAGTYKVFTSNKKDGKRFIACLLYTSPSPRDATLSRMPSSA